MTKHLKPGLHEKKEAKNIKNIKRKTSKELLARDCKKDGDGDDNIDNFALFVGNKNIWYPGVLIEKKAKFENNEIKKLPPLDCTIKEAKRGSSART